MEAFQIMTFLYCIR